MKRGVKTKSSVYAFLLSKGVLEKGTHEEIQKARKEYWREYKRKWRNDKRKKEKEITVSLNKDEMKLLTLEAKRHELSRTQFLKQTFFAYINKSFIVPNRLEVKRIEQLLSMAYNSIQELLEEDKLSTHLGRSAIETIQHLEGDILPLLHNPKTIEEYIMHHLQKSVENKSRLLDLINSLWFVILKSLSRRNNTLQLVAYLFKKEKNEKPQPILKHNLRSRSIKGWAKEFDANEALRVQKRKDNIKLSHTILSFSDKDKNHISKELLTDIAKKFVELRGKDNIYLASSHHDKDHIHLHIVMSGTQYLTGESNRISKREFRDLKLALDNYQKTKYPMLIHSLPNHGRTPDGSLKDKDGHLHNRDGRLSQKQQILEVTEALYNKSKSLDDFLAQLKFQGYEPYYRGGKLYGLENEAGRHFRFKTIGYDKDKLDDLDRKNDQEKKDLQEIRDLRESKSMEREEEYERSNYDDNEEIEDDSDDSDYDGSGL